MLARSERERVHELFAKGVAPQRDVDRTKSAFEVASAELERAEQRLRDNEIALSHAELRSPVAGRVVDRLAEPGDNAVPGVPLLRIYDPEALRLEAPVRESLTRRLALGQHVNVLIEALTKELDGVVEEIVPQAEPGARTFLVKIRFASHAGVFAGMFGRVEVPAGERERLRIPAAAIERIGQLEFVTAQREDGRSERRLVTTGAQDPEGRVEVLSGLCGRRARPGGRGASRLTQPRLDRSPAPGPDGSRLPAPASRTRHMSIFIDACNVSWETRLRPRGARMTADFAPDQVAFYVGDPQAAFRRLRAEDPLHWYAAGPFWCATRHADVIEISRRPRVFSSAHGTQIFEIPRSASRA